MNSISTSIQFQLFIRFYSFAHQVINHKMQTHSRQSTVASINGWSSLALLTSCEHAECGLWHKCSGLAHWLCGFHQRNQQQCNKSHTATVANLPILLHGNYPCIKFPYSHSSGFMEIKGLRFPLKFSPTMQ